MKRSIKTQSGKTIEIENSSLKSGGQGSIYKILSSGYTNYIVKIYHDLGKARMLENKILSMVKYSPCSNVPEIIRHSLAWAECALYENQQFVGYMMPKVNNAIELSELTTPRSPHHQQGPEWKKFDISDADSLRTRLIICYNIGRAVELLHQNGMYTLVDLKPDNIMVNHQGIITIIDLDSIQMVDNNGILRFNADVATEDFAPPEFYNRKIVPKTTKVEQSWDAFSFAVICYKVLFAIHPFQASHYKFSTLAELISNGYFVHSGKKNELKVIPHIHKGFYKIPQNIRQLFHQTFEDGHLNPAKRPVLSNWVNAFSSVLFSKTNTSVLGSYSSNYVAFSPKKPKVFAPPGIQADKQINKDNVVINWITSNAIRCILNGNNVGLKGTISVPLQNNTYTFHVTGRDGTDITKKIVVNEPGPNIMRFELTSGSNGQGILYWNVVYASTVLLNNSPVNNSETVCVNLYLPNYTLTAINNSGISVEKTIKNPYWGSNKKLAIKSPLVQINQKVKIRSSNHQIKYSGKIPNKKFKIHSKF